MTETRIRNIIRETERAMLYLTGLLEHGSEEVRREAARRICDCEEKLSRLNEELRNIEEEK